MKRFTDYNGTQILMSENAEKHIQDFHPEINDSQIQIALTDPDEVRRSSYRDTSVLYYRIRAAQRYVCVVVKACPDGTFISTAMTTAKPKTGEVIYVRKP